LLENHLTAPKLIAVGNLALSGNATVISLPGWHISIRRAVSSGASSSQPSLTIQLDPWRNLPMAIEFEVSRIFACPDSRNHASSLKTLASSCICSELQLYLLQLVSFLNYLLKKIKTLLRGQCNLIVPLIL